MSREYRRDYDLTDDAEERAYLNWAQDGGAHVDAAGNVTWPDQADHPDNARKTTDDFDAGWSR